MISKFLGTVFLSSTLAATTVQADESPTLGIDRFVCVTENADGNPAALFETNVPLYTEDGTDLSYLGRSEQSYSGSFTEGQNLYSRDEERLNLSVEGYEAQQRIGVPSFSTPERHAAQLEEWKKAWDAVRSGTYGCNTLIM